MKHLLFLAHKVPHPPDKGERVRAHHQLLMLSRRFSVTLAALARGEEEERAALELGDKCRVIVERLRLPMLGAAAALATGRSATEGYFASRRLLRRILAAHEARAFDVLFAYCSSVLPLAAHLPDVPAVMDFVDVDSEKWLNFGGNCRGPARLLYNIEGRRVRKLEKRAIAHCRRVFCVSAGEAANSPHVGIHALGNGVDVEYFAPRSDPIDHHDIVFTGTMDYLPNRQAVCWFARNVWPRLKSRFADLTFHVVGRNPARDVQVLSHIDGIVVTGTVDDVRPYIARASVAVAPMRLGRGVQNKILEAMAMAKPVVATRAALESLEIAAGHEALCADEPAQWIDLIAGLLDHPEQCAGIGMRARRRVEESFSWSARLEPLMEACMLAAGDAPHGCSMPCGEKRA
jgi:sugar transferase (PEP-CTERM/EpsH1 system associated)